MSTFNEIDFVKHLPISRDLTNKLHQECLDNKSFAKVFTASNGVITRSIDHLKVIRKGDMTNCVVANKIGQHVSSILGCKASPRYYIQDAKSYLEPHSDHMTISAFNIILDADGPITWEKIGDVYYNCALLNVREVHSVKTNSPRLLLKLAIFDKEYKEILEIISGREEEIFNVAL